MDNNEVKNLLDSISTVPMDEDESREVGAMLADEALWLGKSSLSLVLDDDSLSQEDVLYAYEDYVLWLKSIRDKIDEAVKVADDDYRAVEQSLEG